MNSAAILVGVLAAVVSVTTYIWLLALPDDKAAIAAGSSLWMPAASQAKIAAMLAAFSAIPIVAVCMPIWLILARFRKNGWIAAAVLGLISTVGAWVILFDFSTSLSEALIGGLPIGLCGALAGVTTWWASSPSRVVVANGT